MTPGRGEDDPFARIGVAEAADVFRNALAGRRIATVDTAVVFHDLGRMAGRIARLQAAFPSTTVHTLAIKANPLVAVLRRAVEAGAGLEAASVEEVHLALAAGCAPARIVFDSPAKTDEELAFALERGLYLNADSLEELARIARLRGAHARSGPVGVRVNPGVGTGTIATTSVGGTGSRFGVSLEGSGEAEVVGAFRDHPWLGGIHVHVGSQGCDLALLVAAASRAWRLREAINRATGRVQVGTLDIGGGLPTAYVGSVPRFSADDYAAALRAEVPGLFASGVTVLTEFGRAIQAGCGFAVARVEAVKRLGATPVALIHLGADFLMRPAYQPQHWPHEFAALDPGGVPKAGASEPWTLAGPLCFAGDIVGREVPLPPLAPGDHVVVRDAGAYTLALWSHHCSRAIPLVLGYEGGAGAAGFTTLHRRESPDDIVARWSP